MMAVAKHNTYTHPTKKINNVNNWSLTASHILNAWSIPTTIAPINITIAITPKTIFAIFICLFVVV